MRISSKLIWGTTVPTLVVGAIGFFALVESGSVHRRSASESAMEQSDLVATSIARLLSERVSEWAAYAQGPAVRGLLVASNRNAITSEPDIASRDLAWRNAGNRHPDFMNEALDHPVASEFRALTSARTASHSTVYGVIFLTGRQGCVVAASHRTSDYLQSDEEWWQHAVRDGVYLSPLEFDESSGIQALSLCLRVGSEEEWRGVLKVVWNVEEIFELIDALYPAVAGNSEGLLSLVDGTQTVIHAARSGHPAREVATQLEVGSIPGRRAAVDRDVDGRHYLTGIAELPAPWNERLGWRVISEQPGAIVFADQNDLLRYTSAFVWIVALFGLVFGIAMSVSVSTRVHYLAETIERYGNGQLQTRANLSGHDEIAEIGASFDAMAERIRVLSTELKASVQERDEQLEKRQILEEENALTRNRLEQLQRMEAIGRVAAGLAHEIKTPIQFVGDNVRFLADGYRSISNLYTRVRPHLDGACADAVPFEDRIEIVSLEEECGAEYLIREAESATEEAIQGIDRINAIVSAMKSLGFSNDKRLSTADLNEALRCTLTLARSETKYIADTVTDFEALPPVSCFVGELNQVFLNMLINAAHAIEDRNEGRGTITVTTRAFDDEVVITVRDTGCGIPADLREKIFEEFFTTKDVGKGTGFGLSLTHDIIVEVHGGSIEVESEEGVGTAFIIHLPLVAQPRSAETSAPSEDRYSPDTNLAAPEAQPS
ncbi:MAG: ATP-binding protein [Planctomycetota bacterium]